ncbi:Hsp70 family protein [Microcoleus sp. FACHB-SPT15]|uniref:Hsp70 family protein n=1 Tax=Microcoleus sp. FACHB-SPT15 TaxID=2692830 RepID=UPI00177AF63C|nr:Hsp70 family protein [Microcoleus sp. FACHB-SPT15]MBD1807745.1 Hsp70 family protein [Microcoleus sp. FACHB-SPT15]
MTVIAIDFGTSNTVVCTTDPVTKIPRTLKFNQSRRFETGADQVNVVPSLVFVQEPNQLVIGEQVRSQRLGFTQPERLFQAFKRDLVADYRPPPRQLDGTLYTAETICELFLKQIWQQVLQQAPVTRTIFTVPVGAFERYLDWFRDFADSLGLPNVQLVDESTAAALGYAVKRPGSVVLVVDFGGGTLDLSLIRTVAADNTKKVLRAEVLAKSDAYIGGVDIDVWIVEHYLRQINSSREEVKEIGWQNLLELAEKLKIRLSNAIEATESWFDDENFFAHDLHLTQHELAEILEESQLLEELRQAIDEVLARAISKGISKVDIEQVLLVGGSCQIPAVQQLVNTYFGRNKVKLNKPFEAVAYGALALGELVEVEDYLRHSYAIRLWEPYTRQYSYFTLFEKGRRYPCSRAEPLTLQVAINGQREIRLDIGEVADVSAAEVTYDAQGRMTSSFLNQQSCFRSMGGTQSEVCVAHLEPPGETGVDRIKVMFTVSEQRVLLVTVKDLLTGQILVERGAIAKLQ